MNDRRIRPGLDRTVLVALALGLIAMLAPDAASARTERLQWRHQDESDVSYFRVHWGLSSQNYTSRISVGRPRTGDLFQYDVSVPDTADVYFSVSAVGYSGLESVNSNEILRRAPSSGGGGGGGSTQQLGQPGRPRIISQ